MTTHYGLIDINIYQAEKGYWYSTKTSHRAERPGDDNPASWGECAEYDTKEDAVDAAEWLAESLFRQGIVKQVSIFVEGSEHKSW